MIKQITLILISVVLAVNCVGGGDEGEKAAIVGVLEQGDNEAPARIAIGNEALEDPLRVKERNHRYSFWRKHHGPGKKVIHVAEERFQLDQHSRESVQREATQEQCVASNQHEFVPQEDGKPEADVTKFKGFWSRTVPKFAVCTHGYDDLITSHFMKRGYWNDCLKLPNLAMAAVEVEALMELNDHFIKIERDRARREDWKNRGKEISENLRQQLREAEREKLLPRILDNLESPLVVDVGANIGTCSLLLASQAMEVIAFEALERSFIALNASVYLNDFQGLISLNYAAVVSEEDESELRHVQHERHVSKNGTHRLFGTGRLKVHAEAKDTANYGDAVVRVAIEEPQEKGDPKPEEDPDKSAHRYVNDFTGGKPHSKLKGLSAVYLDYSIEAELTERDLFRLRLRQEEKGKGPHPEVELTDLDHGEHDEPMRRQRSHVNLLKIDCQGCELGALHGAKKMLKDGLIDVIQLDFDLKVLAAGRNFVPENPAEGNKGKPTASDERAVGRDLLQLLIEYDYTVYDLSEAHKTYENSTLLDFPHCYQYYLTAEDSELAIARSKGRVRRIQKPLGKSEDRDRLIETVQENGATELIAISPKIAQRFHCLERFLLPTQPIVLSKDAQGSLKTERAHIASHSELLMKEGLIPGVPLDFSKDVKPLRQKDEPEKKQ